MAIGYGPTNGQDACHNNLRSTGPFPTHGASKLATVSHVAETLEVPLLFHTIEFALLLAGVLLALTATRTWKSQNVLLLLASYVFYGWWDARFLLLLAFSTGTDYVIGQRLGRTEAQPTRRALVATSCVVNLGLLGYFKYAGLFASTANGIGAWLGLGHLQLPLLQAALPVGISFYTFQTLGYTIDVYRRRLKPCESLRDFALYVSFFPQLVAGPIERAGRLLPQITRARSRGLADVEVGLFLFASGWLRKAIGDQMGHIVDPAFASPDSMSSWTLVWALYAFSFQIYLDFSGYTDMARGVGKLLGFDLMENFRAPYLARNIREFWSRWHISLSTWLRDYLYIPLGGNRGTRLRTLRNLLITMLLGGLWHGAAWSFVLWGGIHGILLAGHRLWQSASSRSTLRTGLPRQVLGAFLTFHCVSLAWLVFRVRPVAEQSALEIASEYLGGLAGLLSETPTAPPIAFWLVALILLLDIAILRTGTHLVTAHWRWWLRGAVVAGGLALAWVLTGGPSDAFLYFRF